MAKKKDKTTVSFVGMNASDVTGSMIHVKYKDSNILLDAGYYQCSNKFKQWTINSSNIKFKIKELDSIIISHLNLDHWGGLGRLFNRGCNAKIYIPKKSKEYLHVALKTPLRYKRKILNI